MPKVTVIMPVYNAEDYLPASLDSVLNQSFQELELICVDDGSTDSSLKILQMYQERDPRIKILTQKNSGGSAARNLGLAHADGEYVMFIDADDLYAHDIITQAYNRASEENVDIVFYNFARFVSKPTKLAVVNRNAPTKDIARFSKETYSNGFFNDFAIITWNKLIKRGVIADNNITFSTELSHNHDVDFSIRIMLAAQTYSWVNVVGYYYRANDTGITATKRSDPTNVLKILLKLNEKIEEDYKELSRSFHDYVADMIVGTLRKYRDDDQKVRLIAEFAHDVLIQKMNMGEQTYVDHSGIYQLVSKGEYERVVQKLNNPKQKIRSILRHFYDVGQRILPRITV